jgi:hypothetical protein
MTGTVTSRDGTTIRRTARATARPVQGTNHRWDNSAMTEVRTGLLRPG